MRCVFAKTQRGNLVACTNKVITEGKPSTFVPVQRCESCTFNTERTPYFPIIDLTDCDHRSDTPKDIQANCGCRNIKTLPVSECKVHGWCSTHSPTRDRIAETFKRNGEDKKCKDCNTCKDIWIPELNRTEIVYVHYNPCRFKRPVENVFTWWESLGSLQKITRGVHLVFDDSELLLPNAERIKAVDGQGYFIKEALINYALSQTQAEYFAWVDADLVYPDTRWIQYGIKLLDKYKAVQLWERLVCPVPEGFTAEVDKLSAASQWVLHQKNNRTPGGAWVMRTADLKAIGGLPETHITGGGDSVLWSAFLNEASTIYWDDMLPSLREEWYAYREKCQEVVGGKIGYVPVTTTHLFHGTRQNRKYMDRTSMLRSFDPAKDVAMGSNGLPVIANKEVHDAVYAYMLNRKEDE